MVRISCQNTGGQSLIDDLLPDEMAWFDTEIYGHEGKSSSLPQHKITAYKRHSFRAEVL